MTTPPNLLFLWTDQHATSALGCYGNERIETPILDGLADQGTQFRQAYCTQPVCTPSRSSILTGRYPHQTGCVENNVPFPPEARCLPECGDFADYTTAYFGKWHLIESAFLEPIRTVVTADGWKFNWHPSAPDELYDLREDPGETENLAASGHDERIEAMRSAIREWQVRTRDPIYLS